jgi:hypothetical protein
MRSQICTNLSGTVNNIEDARGQAGFGVDLGEGLAVEGGEFTGLVDHGVAGGEARRGFPQGTVIIRTVSLKLQEDAYICMG